MLMRWLGGRIALQVLLDKRHRYRVKDATETWWTFVWEVVEDFQGWQAYRRRPRDLNYLGQGFWTSEDVIRWIREHPGRMTSDDLIDSVVWLRDGGVEALFCTIGLSKVEGERV